VEEQCFGLHTQAPSTYHVNTLSAQGWVCFTQKTSVYIAKKTSSARYDNMLLCTW